MLEMRNTVTERKNAFDGLIRLDMAEERSSPCGDMAVAISKTKKQRVRRKWDDDPQTVGRLLKVSHRHNGNTQRRRKRK